MARAARLRLVRCRAEAAAIARRVLVDLKTQHAQSPRLALARALAPA